MNTNDPWKRLSNAARRRPPSTEDLTEMPRDFDTRVLARVRDPRALSAELWLRLAWRTVPVGAAAFLVCWLALSAPAPSLATPDLVEQLMQEVLTP